MVLAEKDDATSSLAGTTIPSRDVVAGAFNGKLSIQSVDSMSVTAVLCAFTGSLPSELGQLGALQVLHGYTNSVTGSIPSELGLLHAML